MLTQKTALVCGSTQGIGRACAVALAEQGANVVLLARDRGRLEAVRAELPRPDSAQAHDLVVADTSDPPAVRVAVDQLLSQRGTLHILVNNTGGPPAGPIAEATPEAFLAAFQSHLITNQLLAQAVLPGMRAAGYGRIVNVISTSVKQPIPGLGVSNTTRGAVASWAKTLAGEVGRFGITVNNVLPGATRTARFEAIVAGKVKASSQPRDAVERALLAEIPLGRFGEAEEIAAVVAFLASPAASYVTGVSLPVDGGRTTAL